MREHKFHRIIGNAINDLELSEERFQILKDTACGGIHKLSLFFSVIIEIEESNVKPVHLFGKFLASAMSKYYIYGNKDVSPIGMAQSVFFIQILETSGLKDVKAKYKQWHLVEESIQGIIPVKESRINKYKLIYGKGDDFKEDGEKIKTLITNIIDFLALKIS